MKDEGLILVAAAAAVLFMVIKKTTPTSTQTNPLSGVGSSVAPFWSQFGSSQSYFGFAPYSVDGSYIDPGQVTVAASGQVTESPFGGVLGVLP
ncbi:MAG: hypothetical protein J0I36_18000, partial [Pandoraea sp.]|nr:hypothetical protein [Pandoraea sp.]